MEKSTIEIKMTNQENGEITEIKISTDDINRFEEFAYLIQEAIYKN